MGTTSRRIACYVIGLIILTFGISLTIKADLGAGAWDALNVGLAEKVGLTVGSWVVLVGIVLILLNAFLTKEKPDIFALITIIIAGACIDFWLLQVFESLALGSKGERLAALFIGIFVLAMGVSLYLQAKFAAIPVDGLMFALHKRFGWSLMTAKTVGEVAALLLALLFSGPVGIGTIIITAAIGPLVELFYPKISKMVKLNTI
ncbi:YczE/YyaS/YitT family protein [Bacillus taeanensis]|uniref:Membrane protein n=1 Tax=Bacillus taeanensis TaxID=273032 RepID=A0A366XSN4_9BACI|nr:YitT family protein [Bacillus taeanensis]RBW68155.1 membrane protein [Bacillus taeanensis]